MFVPNSRRAIVPYRRRRVSEGLQRTHRMIPAHSPRKERLSIRTLLRRFFVVEIRKERSAGDSFPFSTRLNWIQYVEPFVETKSSLFNIYIRVITKERENPFNLKLIRDRCN